MDVDIPAEAPLHAETRATPTGRPHWRPLVVATVLLAALGCNAIVERVGSMGRWGWHPSSLVTRSDTAFVSDGHRIVVERFAPASVAQMQRGVAWRHLPAILVLHASGGMLGRGGATARAWADAFAEHGYIAFVVHYFDRTDDARTDDAREDAVFPEWTEALHDAVTFARSDAHVDAARVDAFGVSLGGFMALALGAGDSRVSRLVVLSGGFFPALAPEVRRLPPTLLLHGDSDDVVPIAQARRVDSTLTRLRVPHALVVYPGASHTLDDSLSPDAVRRALLFLDARRAEDGAVQAIARVGPAGGRVATRLAAHVPSPVEAHAATQAGARPTEPGALRSAHGAVPRRPGVQLFFSRWTTLTSRADEALSALPLRSSA